MSWFNKVKVISNCRGISFDQNTSFEVKKESSTCESNPKRDNLTSASKNTESLLHNNCFTHTSHQKTAVNEEKENFSDFEEDNFQQYLMKNRIEKSFYDRHRKKLNYKTYSPLPKVFLLCFSLSIVLVQIQMHFVNDKGFNSLHIYKTALIIVWFFITLTF